MSFIYLFECSNNDGTVYKIGYTRGTTSKRIQALQTGNSQEIREICKFETKHNRKLETAIHNQYSHKKIKNEWFDLDITEVANFLNNCEKIENNFDALKNNPFFNKI